MPIDNLGNPELPTAGENNRSTRARATGTDLAREIERLAKSQRPQERGYRFEDLLAEYFRRHGFMVRKSPRSTRSRQTDLLIQGSDGFKAICSAKWQKGTLGSAEVDGIKLRLERMPKGTVGLLFSMSDYGKGVPEYAAGLRAQFDVLLFSLPEIAMLISGEVGVRELIHEKQNGLAAEGRITFRSEAGRLDADISELDLPSSTASFRAGKPVQRILTVSGGTHDFVYGSRIQAASSGTKGKGVSLNVALPTQTLDDLEAFTTKLPAMIGLSGRCSFAIHQTQVAWHGHGAREMFNACRSWKSRYAANAGPFHHSEHCIFFSNTRSGWVIITFQMDTHLGLSCSSIEIRFPGIPVDPRAYQEIARWVGHPLFFEPVLDEREGETLYFQEGHGPRLDVLSVITDENDRVVRGVVAKNPFRDKSIASTGVSQRPVPAFLREPDTLVCTVADMHPPKMGVDFYFIRRIEVLEMALRPVVEITCTWNRRLDNGAGSRAPAQDHAGLAALLSRAARGTPKRRGLAERLLLARSRQ